MFGIVTYFFTFLGLKLIFNNYTIIYIKLYIYLIIILAQFFHDDCLKIIKQLPAQSIDCVVTSPPYNIGVNYGGKYYDNLPINQYLSWFSMACFYIKHVLKDNGSFFLNIGNKPSEQSFVNDVLFNMHYFKLQNTIIWIKSFDGQGHFKPINSKRYLHNCFEYIFHFTKHGDVEIDKLAIGIPYSDKTNIKRWNKSNDLRDRGNVWFIPYETKQTKGPHPATFPQELPERCIKLHGISNGMKVLDPFMGIGTTGLACKKFGINFIGIDVNEDYVNHAIEKYIQ
jgi:site-specific DNA-methyltransferase (adenine-specific)